MLDDRSGSVYLIWSKRSCKATPAHSLGLLCRGNGKALEELTGMPKLPRTLKLLGWLLAPWYSLKAFQKAMRDHRHLHLLADLHALLKTDTFSAKLPMQPRYVVTKGAKNFEHILKTNFSNYAKGEEFQIPRFHDLLGQGIFNSDGDLWYHQRKTAPRMFKQQLMTTHMWKVVSKNSNKVVDLLLSSDQDASVDVFNVMNRFTLDLGFGRSIGALDNADSPFLNSFDKGQQILFMRLVYLGNVQRNCGCFMNGVARIISDFSSSTVWRSMCWRRLVICLVTES